MVADIAHELRTPLSVMQLDIEGLADGLQGPSEAAASLRDGLETLNRLIEDLRLLSLADAGRLQFVLDELALPPFLQRVAATWQSKMQDQHVQLVTDIPAKLPLIYADEHRLAQVLHNLLSNALRYTPYGGRISLGAQGGQAGVQLWVADSGPGITAEDFLGQILANLGVPSLPETPVRVMDSDALSWSIYLVSGDPTTAVALAESETTTYMVALKAAADEFDGLADALLVPAIMAFTPTE